MKTQTQSLPVLLKKKTVTRIAHVNPLSAGKIKSIALDILKYEYNGDVWLQNNIAVRGRKFIGRKGLGDIIGYEKTTGRMIVCEAKTVNDILSDAQKDLLTKVHNAGGIALLATQEGIKVVVKKYIDNQKLKHSNEL